MQQAHARNSEGPEIAERRTSPGQAVTTTRATDRGEHLVSRPLRLLFHGGHAGSLLGLILRFLLIKMQNRSEESRLGALKIVGSRATCDDHKSRYITNLFHGLCGFPCEVLLRLQFELQMGRGNVETESEVGVTEAVANNKKGRSRGDSNRSRSRDRTRKRCTSRRRISRSKCPPDLASTEWYTWGAPVVNKRAAGDGRVNERAAWLVSHICLRVVPKRPLPAH